MGDAYEGEGGGGGPKLSAGVMSMVAGAASNLQRNAEKGEVRQAAERAENGEIPYLVMEEILERLKMLNYEREMPGSFKPLTHTYFAIASSNPAEQFYYFTSLCAWLMQLQRISWRAPSQMDDPNSAVSALYSQLQEIGAPTNYPPQKLKQGFGEHCCAVLKFLLDAIPIEFKRAVYSEELEYEEAAVDDEAEVEADELHDEVGAADVEEEEFFGGAGEGGAEGPSKLTDSILEATVEPAAWQIEVERVTPMLKMQVLSDPKEWRNRLVHTKSHQQTVAALAPETYTMLDRLSEDMERTLQAVKKSEQKLNQQCTEQVDNLGSKQEKLQQLQDECAPPPPASPPPPLTHRPSPTCHPPTHARHGPAQVQLEVGGDHRADECPRLRERRAQRDQGQDGRARQLHDGHIAAHQDQVGADAPARGGQADGHPNRSGDAHLGTRLRAPGLPSPLKVENHLP